MTAEPTWPGDGPSRNHPGSWKSVGTWTVPSGLSPSADTDTATPMAGIRSVTGTERATTGPTTPDGAGAVPLAANGGASWGTAGPTSGSWWPRRPTARHPVATSSRTTAATHQRLD